MSDRPFTDLYVEYAREITDAPPWYHQYLSYLILSSTLARNIFFSHGYTRLYPNLYLLIMGPSSLYRKSFSQDMAADIIREVRPDFEIMDTSSRESFISELARTDRLPVGAGLVVIDEMAGFMARAKKSQHFAGYIQDLCSVFSGRPIRRRVGVSEEKKEVFRVEEPFLNITAACSYDWLTKSIETSDITGGFFARFLWIIPGDKQGPHWAAPRRGDEMKRAGLVQYLQRVQDLVGECSFNPDADNFFSTWYSRFREEYQGGKWDPYYERLTTQAKKIALLNAAQNFRRIVNADDLFSAMKLIEPLARDIKGIVMGDTADEVMRGRIIAFVEKAGEKGVRRSDILNGVNGLDAQMLVRHMETLVQAERVETVRDGRRLVYRAIPK